MGDLWDAATSFPAIVPGLLLVPVVLYWACVLAGAVDVDLVGDGADLDAPDAGSGTAGAPGGAAGGIWQALGLGGVPLTVSLSVAVAVAWFVTLAATAAADSLGVPPAVRAIGGAAVIVVALVVGALAAAVVARPLGRLFTTTTAEGRAAFVGRMCTVRTAAVTDRFGQAEATDPSGATVLLQVRLAEPGELRRGMEALIFDYDPDAEVFLVSPADDALGAGPSGAHTS